MDGFDAVCQQKLLQCYGLEPDLTRSYPPCLLEWTTNRKKAGMALYAGFSDGQSFSRLNQHLLRRLMYALFIGHSTTSFASMFISEELKPTSTKKICHFARDSINFNTDFSFAMHYE